MTNHTRYQENINRGLNKAYRLAAMGSIELDEAKLIIFSDHHKGVGDDADDFAPSEMSYSAAMRHYFDAGYTLLVVGDAEELWEDVPAAVLRTYPEIFELENKFHGEGRYFRFWGNHDDEWRNPDQVERHLGKFFDNLSVRESQRFTIFDRGVDLGEIFIVHGHQGLLFADRFGWLSRLFIRYLWRPFQRIFNIKIPQCGGLWLSKKIAAIAESAGIPCICGGRLALEIVRQASRHFVASTAQACTGYAHEGPGPAGLAAAYDLAKDGFQVEVIEAFSEPGGMLRWAIPPFRLPRQVLDRDIRYIEKLGVDIKTSIKFGTDVTLSDLKKDKSDAIIIAIGTHQGLKMGVENERNISGYIDCLTFLRDYACGERFATGNKTIIVGGGNAAIDAARSAVRCGAKEVKVFYRRSYQEMTADIEEIEAAQAEGIEIEYLSAPVRIREKDGKVQGLQFVKTKLGEPDKSGLRVPIPIKGSEFVVKATSIISAIGKQPDLAWNRDGLPFKFSPRNTFIVDDRCLTNIEGVFATGDAVNGPTTIVEAMASGRKVASSLALYLTETG